MHEIRMTHTEEKQCEKPANGETISYAHETIGFGAHIR